MTDILKKLFLIFAFVGLAFSCRQGQKPGTQQNQNEIQKPSDVVTPGDPDEMRLVSFKIQDNEQAISDNKVDCGNVKLARLKVQAEAWPYDAKIDFEPALQDGIFWDIGSDEGDKELTVILKKDEKTRQYKVHVKKIGDSSLSLSSIIVGDERRDDEEIISNLQFADVDKGKVEVKVSPSVSSAQVAFQDGAFANEKSWEWKLFNGENILKIRLKNGDEEASYTVRLFSLASPLATNFYLNGNLISKIKDGFYEKAMKNGNPLFEAGCNALNMQFSIIGQLEALIINGEKQNFNKNDSTKRIFLSEMLNEEEKDFLIQIIPTDEAMERKSSMQFKFRVKGSANKAKPLPKLIINGDEGIGESFLQDAADASKKAVYKIFESPAEIKIDLTGYEYNVLVKDVLVNGEKLVFNPKGSHNYGKKEFKVEDGKEVPVEVNFVPFDSNKTEEIKWNFVLQTGGDKPALQNVKFYAINDEGYIGIGGELPTSFEEHLRDGSFPLYEFDGKNATVVVGSTIKDIIKDAVFKLDGANVATVEPKEEGYNVLCPYTFSLSDGDEHNVEIIVNPTEEDKWSALKYSFKLKKSGKKAKLPCDSVLYMSFNGVDRDNFPSEIKEHLEDGSMPLLQIVGKDVAIDLSFTNKIFEKIAKAVSFKVDNEDAVEVDFREEQKNTGKIHIARHAFALQDVTKSHPVKMEVIPKDEEHYERRTYSIRIKSRGKADMPLIFGVNLQPVKNGDKIEVNAEKMTLVVQSPFDVIGNVKMGIKGAELKECQVEKKKAVSTGREFWQASCDIVLVEGNVVEEKHILAIVEPKDAEQYLQTTLEFSATGTSGFSNAEFEQLGKYGAKLKAENEWKPGCESRFMDDYGAVATTLTFYTVHPRASVKYAIVGEDGLMIDSTIKTATSAGDGSHKSERIILFQNKPTKVKAWVIAEDGITENAIKGVCYFDGNSVLVNYRYTKVDKVNNLLTMKDFPHNGGDVIKLNKDDIQADNTVHLIFGILTDETQEPFIVVEDDVGNEQTAFKKASKDLKAGRQCYVTTLNVEKLLLDVANGGAEELILKCHIKKTEGAVDCFTYEVKVKLNK